MKNKILLTLCLLIFKTAKTQQLIPFHYAHKWGYMNENREIVIQPQFEEADFFNGNIARIRMNRYYGVIDKTGKIIHPCQYEYTDYFSDGFMKIRKSRMENGKELKEEFLLDRNGKILNPNRPLEDIYYSSKIVVGKDFSLGKYIFLDTNFVQISKESYDFASYFNGDFATVKIDNKYTLINRSGEQMFPPIDHFIFPLEEGYAYYANDGYTIIDKKGQVVTNNNSVFPTSIKDILVIKQQLGKTVVTNIQGKKLLETDKKLKPLNGKYLVFTDPVSSKSGVIDIKGKVILKPLYAAIQGEFRDVFIVKDDNSKLGVVNKTGQIILPFEFSNISFYNNFLRAYKTPSSKPAIYSLSGQKFTNENCQTPFLGDIGSSLSKEYKGFIFLVIDNKKELLDSNGVFYNKSILPAEISKPRGTQVRRYRNSEGKWVFINEFDEVVVPYQYDDMDVISDGIMAAKKNGKWGYVTDKGVEIVPCEYDKAIYFVEGFGRLEKDGKWGMVNTSGKFVVELKYDEVGYLENGNLFGTKNGVRTIFTRSGDAIGSHSMTTSTNNSTSNVNTTPQVYCVSFIMTNGSKVYLYMVQVTDNTGSASQSKIIQAARENKNKKIWNGYYESGVLVDTMDCLKAKELATKSNFRYDDFQVDYITIR
jgi:hypothetical protein